jgi:hypothetical protein
MALRWRWLIHLLALALFATGLTLVLERRGVIGGRDEADLPALAQMPFATSVSVVGSPTTRVGSSVQLSAAGYSPAGSKEVALYDGARRVAKVPAGRYAGATSLSLPAMSAGQHLVHVEVTDRDGKVSKSAPVAVTVAPATGKTPIPVPVTFERGEIITAAAHRLGLPAASLVVVAPDGTAFTGRGRIPKGSKVDALVKPQAGLAAAEGRKIVVDQAVVGTNPGLALAVAAKGCAIELTASKAKGDVTFFRSSATVPGWAEVARPGKTLTRTIADLSPGTHVFYARDDDGISTQVSVTVPQQCASRFGWTGDASIVNGVLTVPKGVSGAYLHLSVDGRPWLRAPAQADQGFPLHSGSNVSAFLPALNGHRLDLEVWTTSMGDVPPLKPAATGHLSVPGDTTLASVVGESGAVNLTVEGPNGALPALTMGSDHQTLHFDWSSATSRTESVQWQVLSQKVVASDRDLTPPGLLASGVSDAGGGSSDVLGGGRKGEFTIDTSKIPMQDSPLSPKSESKAKSPGVVLLKPPVSAGGIASLGSAAYGTQVLATDVGDVVADVLPLPREGDAIYVRVLARSSGAAVSAASAPVTITLPVHESAKTGLTFKVDSLKLDAGHAPYKPAAGCLIVDVPWLGHQPLPELGAKNFKAAFDIYAASVLYPKTGVYCPGAFPPAECDFLCDLEEFIVDAAGVIVGVVIQVYSLIAYAYNGVVDGVIDAIAQYNPLCVGLGAASSDAGSGCSAVVAVATRAAVTAALASVGLPPSLPSGEALKAAASGQFAQLAVELMKQANIPCDDVKAPAGFADAVELAGDELGSDTGSAASAIDDPCLAIATMLIGAVADKAEATAEQSLAAASGLPAFPDIKGISMTPDPRAVLEPLRVTVEASLVKDTADGTGAKCRMMTFNPLMKGSPSWVAPYSSSYVVLTEDKPVDGKGRWSGSAISPPDGTRPNSLDLLQPRSFEVGVGSYMSSCSIPKTVGTVTIKAPRADLDDIVKAPKPVTLP